ncbi:hypothetical protein BLNAU_25183 [Blattamonas nauphoetae]|uniref:Uncharacterized protein n=1 Tax=Blattamonas nauphoetae TaxID=2049346 RepID=A0ABQ9WKA4_9EUKA|nr:hypothetical protein BLNAU_25183 [Blattamonas nauphoetae]
MLSTKPEGEPPEDGTRSTKSFAAFPVALPQLRRTRTTRHSQFHNKSESEGGRNTRTIRQLQRSRFIVRGKCLEPNSPCFDGRTRSTGQEEEFHSAVVLASLCEVLKMNGRIFELCVLFFIQSEVGSIAEHELSDGHLPFGAAGECAGECGGEHGDYRVMRARNNPNHSGKP